MRTYLIAVSSRRSARKRSSCFIVRTLIAAAGPGGKASALCRQVAFFFVGPAGI